MNEFERFGREVLKMAATAKWGQTFSTEDLAKLAVKCGAAEFVRLLPGDSFYRWSDWEEKKST